MHVCIYTCMCTCIYAYLFVYFSAYADVHLASCSPNSNNAAAAAAGIELRCRAIERKSATDRDSYLSLAN